MQDGRVIPLLLDLDFKEVSGPLAQFQAKKSDGTGIRELVVSLNKAATVPVPDAQLDKLFTALWGDLEKQIASIPKSNAPAKHNRPQGEILEELVSSVRSVEMRVRDVMDGDPNIRTRRRSRMHPGMMHEIMHRTSEGPRDPIQILFIAGFLRDDAPWIYEMGLEAYRAIRSGRKEEAQTYLIRFLDAVELIQRGPFAEELGIDRAFLKLMRSDFFGILELLRNDGVENRNSSVRIRKQISPDKKA